MYFHLQEHIWNVFQLKTKPLKLIIYLGISYWSMIRRNTLYIDWLKFYINSPICFSLFRNKCKYQNDYKIKVIHLYILVGILFQKNLNSTFSYFSHKHLVLIFIVIRNEQLLLLLSLLLPSILFELSNIVSMNEKHLKTMNGQ